MFSSLMCRLIMASLAVSSSCAFAQTLSLEQMPVGSEVTLPPTARTTVPMGSRVKLTSTDNPQTIRIVPVGNGSTFPAPIKLAIFDTHQDRVKYVQVSPNAPFLYSFKGLSSISIQPSLAKGSAAAGTAVQMEIESDKAITVSR